MQLTDNDIHEFQELWRQEFDEDISPEFAGQRAFEILELYALLAQPLPSATPDADETLP